MGGKKSAPAAAPPPPAAAPVPAAAKEGPADVQNRYEQRAAADQAQASASPSGESLLAPTATSDEEAKRLQSTAGGSSSGVLTG